MSYTATDATALLSPALLDRAFALNQENAAALADEMNATGDTGLVTAHDLELAAHRVTVPVVPVPRTPEEHLAALDAALHLPAAADDIAAITARDYTWSQLSTYARTAAGVIADELGEETPEALLAIIDNGDEEAATLFVLDQLREDMLGMAPGDPERPQAITAADYIARRLQRGSREPIRIARDGFAALLNAN